MADLYEFIDCPACGKRMQKVFLEEHQFIVDVCLEGCGGIWLDNREFEKIDEKHEDIKELTEAYEGLTFAPVDTSKDRICPVCHKKMVKNFASAKKEVEIDECYHCGGKFLDYNELEKIRNEYNNNEERAEASKDMFKSTLKTVILNGLIDTNDL